MRKAGKNRIAVCIMAVVLSIAVSACKKGPDVYELRDAAINEYDHGNYEAAREGFNAALDSTRRKGSIGKLQIDILKYRAECEVRLGDFDAAAETFNIITELDGSEEDAQYIAEMTENINAFKRFQKACEQMKDGEYENGYEVFSEYADLSDDNSVGRIAWFNKAVCAEYMLNFDEAYELFAKYCAVYPDDKAAEKEMMFCESRR